MTTVAKEITQQNFEPVVKSGGIVLLDFWAGWCMPCRSFAPTFEAAAKKHPDITFGKVDTEEQSSLAAAFEIRSIPTLMAFKEGVLVFAQPGALPAASLETLISELRKLDMSDVRKKLAQEQARGSA